MNVYILKYLFCLSHTWWNMATGDYFTHGDNKTEPFLVQRPFTRFLKDAWNETL